MTRLNGNNEQTNKKLRAPFVPVNAIKQENASVQGLVLKIPCWRDWLFYFLVMSQNQ